MAGNSDTLNRVDDGAITTGSTATNRYDLQSPIYYVGSAPIGSADTASVWNITKYDLSANPYSAKVATAAAWSTRTGATYL